MPNSLTSISPAAPFQRLRTELATNIKTTERQLDSLKTAYEAINSVGAPDDMAPPAPVTPETPEKIDKRKFNGGNSTKAKDPRKDGRRNNGRKPGTKTAKRGRKRATAKA